MSEFKAETSSSNPLRSSFKPIGVKSFNLLNNKIQQVKSTTSPYQLNMNQNKNIENPKTNELQDFNYKNNLVSPRNFKQQNKNLVGKQFQNKGEGYHNVKKHSVQLQPNSIPRRKNSQQIKNLTLTKFGSDPQNNNNNNPSQKKEDLRTSFTINSLSPKTFDKDFLRKTTFAPIKGLFNSTNQSQKGQNTETNQYGNSPQTSQQSNSKYIFKKPKTQSLPLTGPEFSKKLPSKQSSVKKCPIVCGFYLGKSLGAGKFGQVYLAKHIQCGFICALKKIVKSKVKEFNMLGQLIQQIKLHAFLNHPNIIQFYGVVSDEENIYLILQYMQGGTLFDYLNQRQKLSQQEAIVFVRQTVQAVKYLHDIDIAHRDIKPENIVISYGLAKLCDFGWAARVQGARKTYCGTFDYAPPQILQRKQYDGAVDLWCLGVLTYQLLTGRVPFEHKQRKMVMYKIVNVDKDKIIYPQDMSPQARQFIENLVKKNPNQRTKSYKLLDQPFLKKKQPNSK